MEFLPGGSAAFFTLGAVEKDLLSGTVGGMAGIVVGQPLDTVKVRMQAAAAGRFRNTVDALVQTVRYEGFTALFKGMLSPLLGNGIMNAIMFAEYGRACRYFEDHDSNSGVTSFWVATMAGAYSGFAQSFVASPIEMVKCKLQIQEEVEVSRRRYTSTWDVVRKTWNASGVRGINLGLWSTILRDSGSFAVYFPVYYGVRDMLSPAPAPGKAVKAPIFAQLVAGAVSGVIAWGATYPIDVVKSVIQVVPETEVAPTMTQVIRDGYRSDGLRYFSRGLTPVLLRAIPCNAVTLCAYEQTMSFVGKDSTAPLDV